MLSSTYSLGRSAGLSERERRLFSSSRVVLLPARGEFGEFPNVGPMGG
jgi:hypothetical protein